MLTGYSQKYKTQKELISPGFLQSKWTDSLKNKWTNKKNPLTAQSQNPTAFWKTQWRTVLLFLTYLSSILRVTLEVSPHHTRRIAHVHQGELAIYLRKHEVANQTNPKKRCNENYQYLFLTKVWITTVLIPRMSSTSSAANFQNDCQLSHTWKLLLIPRFECY